MPALQPGRLAPVCEPFSPGGCHGRRVFKWSSAHMHALPLIGSTFAARPLLCHGPALNSCPSARKSIGGILWSSGKRPGVIGVL